MSEHRSTKSTLELKERPVICPENRDFVALCSSTSRQELFLAGALLLLLLLTYRELLPRFSSVFLGGIERDAGLYVWLARSNARDFFSLPWFNTRAFYPYGETLAWSDNFLLPSAAVKLLLLSGLALPAAYNLVLLGAIFLNGYLTARLTYRLTGAAFPAFAAGAVFMTLSFFSNNLGHPQLQFAFWFPLGLSFLFSFFKDRKIAPLIWAALCVNGALLCTVYYAVFLVLLLGSTCLAVLILRPRAFSAQDYLKMLAAAAAGVLPLTFFIAPYLEVRSTFGERGIYEAYYFSANILSWFSAGPFSTLYSVTAGSSHDEAHLFPGILLYEFTALAFVRLAQTEKLNRLAGFFLSFFVLGLLCTIPFPRIESRAVIYLGVAAQWAALFCFAGLLLKVGALERQLKCFILTNRDLLGIFLLSALLSALLAFGPEGNPEKGHMALSVFRPFYELVPGFNSIRAIARIGVVTLFCITLVFGLTVSYLEAKKKYRYFRTLTALLLLAVLAENHVNVFPQEGAVPAPPVFKKFLEMEKGGEALVVLPFTAQIQPDGQVKSWGDFAEKNVRYMHWAFDSKAPLVNGYSGQRSKLMRELPGHTKNFPDQRALRALGNIAGLRYIIYLPKYDTAFERGRFLTTLTNAPELKTVHEDAEGNFLFEFAPNRLINSQSSYLLVPAFTGGELRLGLLALYEPGTPAIRLEIADEALLDRPVAVFQLTADGQWHEFTVTLHEAAQRVRPRKLVFRTETEAPLYLGASEFIGNGF